MVYSDGRGDVDVDENLEHTFLKIESIDKSFSISSLLLHHHHHRLDYNEHLINLAES